MFNFFGTKNLPYSEITPQQVAQKVKQGSVLVIDVREPYEYSQGHIAGSKLVPLRQLGSYSKELGSPEQEIILVCRSGGRSSQAAAYLANQGFKNLLNMKGGMMAWQLAGLPIKK